MNKDDIRRAFTGNSHGAKGIRGAAAAQQPSLLGITAKTSAEKAKYGVWKKKPVGIHDVRDTYATEAEDIFEAAALGFGGKVMNEFGESSLIFGCIVTSPPLSFGT